MTNEFIPYGDDTPAGGSQGGLNKEENNVINLDGEGGGGLFAENERKEKKRHGRKYAKAFTTFEVGVHAACRISQDDALRHVRGIVLTSPDGENNTRVKIMQHARTLRKRLAVLGITCVDAQCLQLSAPSHVKIKKDGTPVLGKDGKPYVTHGEHFHLHGIWRFDMVYKPVELYRIFSREWKQIHGAHDVHVLYSESYRKLINYVLHDTLASFSNGKAGYRQRLMVSEDWLPPKTALVEKWLTRWGVYSVGLIRAPSALEWKVDRDQVWKTWRVLLMSWAEGKVITVKTDEFILYAHCDNVLVFEVEKEKQLKDYLPSNSKKARRACCFCHSSCINGGLRQTADECARRFPGSVCQKPEHWVCLSCKRQLGLN